MKKVIGIVTLFVLFGFTPGKIKYGKIAFFSAEEKAIVFYNKANLDELLLVELKESLSNEKKKEFVTNPTIANTKIIELQGKSYLYVDGKTNRTDNEVFQAHISLEKSGNDYIIKSKGNLNSFARSASHMHFSPGSDENNEYTNGEYHGHGPEDSIYSSSKSAFEKKGLETLLK